MDVFNGKKAVIKISVTEKDNYASLGKDDYVSYSLYDVEGNIIDGIDEDYVDLDSLEDKTMINIVIPEEANVLDDGLEFDNRILIVNYTINEVEHSERFSYRIIPFVPYVCNKNDVRNLLGVPDTVIEDSMIDVYAGYLKCKSLFEDDSTLDALLIERSKQTSLANRAIAICTALSFRNSLPLLTPKIESDGVASQTRFTMTAEDFANLFNSLEDELSDLIAELEEEDLDDRYSPDLFLVGNLTDTFTGS